MKTALYFEDGTTQVVLTPETPFEREVLNAVQGDNHISVCRGGFYDCQGGWVRHQGPASSTESVMLRLDKRQADPNSAGEMQP